MSSTSFAPKLERFNSGIPGLDRVLGGGFFTGGVYIVEGRPGAGKTIFANQLAFHAVRKGKCALYVTLLAESHTRLLQHLQDMTFFDASAIPEQLTYVSGFRALEEGGLKALLDLVRQELRAHRAKLIVLDGFAAVGESASSDRDFKKFVHELQVHAALASCTIFLLSSGVTEHDRVQPVHTMVDGLVQLNDRPFGVRMQRELVVQKFRGSAYLRGVHSFDISDEGVHVRPRLESFSADLADAGTSERLLTGVPQLDAMLGGGLRCGTTAMLLGPTGVGKTILGYSFLGQSTAGSRGLLLSFYETPKRALAKALGVGIDLEARCRAEDVEIMWQSPVEPSLDVIGERILEAVARRSVKRLFIDGFNALKASAAYVERVPQFFGALARELRAHGVTTVYSAELHAIFSPQIQPPVHGISPLLEDLVIMRFVEVEGTLRRIISVLKLRESEFDPAIREYVITGEGIRVHGRLDGMEAIMTGSSHATPAGRPPSAGHRTKKKGKRRPVRRRG
ncbi:MAG TPA: ATPase domain-containing protein [Polyangiaceae bacterium]|jgi:circadian clock protein KaiC